LNYSIAQARQAIEHLIALYENEILPTGSTLLEPANYGALVLAWLERRQELIKALDRLERERPDLVDLFAAFPGATIADVREAK
jgi:hypothetical protein